METRDSVQHSISSEQVQDWGVSLTTNRARALRREQTPAEKRLWKALRARQLDGMKFKRQVAIGEFIADFCCREHRPVVELDGDQHAEQRAAYDSWRTKILEQRGFRVVRFWSQEVMTNLDGVLDALLETTRRTSP